MKIKILLIILLFASNSNAQKNEASSLEKTIALAKEKQKSIILFIDAVIPAETRAKIKPETAFENPEVFKKAKENFVLYKTNRQDAAIRDYIINYRITRFPAFLFLNTDAELFHIDFGYSASNQKFLTMLDQALLKKTQKPQSQLQKEIAANPTDIKSIKQLIESRISMGQTDNALLIEKYVQNLNIADFNDYQTVLFILKAAPYTDGTAFRLASLNRKIYDSIYKKEPLSVRTAINNNIINNSMQQAIKTRSLSKAHSVANFSQSTWGRDYIQAGKSYSAQMLNYYYGIRDTTSYFNQAKQHVSQYYLNLSAESAKIVAIQAQERQRMLTNRPTTQNTVSKEKIDSLMKANPNGVIRRTESFVEARPAVSPAAELNAFAYNVYKTKTKNINHLTQAMIWAKRAIELQPDWPFYDTLSHIYYAMNMHSEALATQKIAVELVKKQPIKDNITRITETYEKMKSKTL